MYTSEAVKRALPLLWHDDMLPVEGDAMPPSPDMPTQKYVDPHRASTLWCIRVDVTDAWKHTDLEEIERQVCFLRSGLDLGFEEISDIFDIAPGYRQWAYKIHRRAIDKMTDYLNGVR